MSFPTYKNDKSSELYARATKVIPSGVYGHLGPAEGQFIPVQKWPRFSEKAKGAYFWDVDGNRYIDYMCAYGPNVLGYGDPDVDKAALAQLKLGNCTTSPNKIMVDCAELLVDTVNSADWAFFAKNGNDVTQAAILTARAYTHRKKIIFFNGFYHGVSAVVQKIDYPGILPEDVANNLYVPWDDIDGLKKVIEENKGEIAGLIAQPYDHGNFYDNKISSKEFWQQVRKLCDDNGIILIIDDVRAGFRLDLAGSDHYFGFKADLICFCKALANGYNMSALCGREFLKSTVSGLSYTGSYWMSAVPFAACIACINKMKKLDTPKLFREMGTKLTDGLVAAGKEHGFDLVVSGAPALFYLRIANDDSMLLHQEWIAECVNRGVFFASHHNHFINAALTDEDIKLTTEIAEDAFSVVAKNHPEIPELH
ncbi:MAG: aminotransferase class III-fold pyridoxal phosphate-dependent enzyme [Oscillospiraceae bacterium]|nr:aminotransferase class III-fold pyridoxal phosphate-dependent enzyme [Oscillospiraceae bacterium]